MKLYYHSLSGHSHRARLMVSLLDLPVELIEVDLLNGAHKSPEFLAMNPFGQVPVLEDAGTVVADSNAILVYLAKKAGRRDLLPEDPKGAAAVQRWLSVAAGEIAYGPAAARMVTLFRAPFDHGEVIARAHAILERIDAQLAECDWLAGNGPTIADVAIYSYVARAPEGGVDLSGYRRVAAFLRRMEELPGFVPFIETGRAEASAA